MTNHFNKSSLTPADVALLKSFENRRAEFDRLMAESNIIYSKKTCPGCGFPTLDIDDFFGTCMICLWEGSGAEKNDTYQGPPNYISLIEHRINISSFLQLFNQSYEIDMDIDKIMQGIIHFEQGNQPIDRNNFQNNLKNILPVQPKLY
jgi:hypothetical protein